MKRAGLIALATLLLYAGPARAGEPTFAQKIQLVPGWNAIYLNVQPVESDPAIVFAGKPVLSAWTRGAEPGGPDFIVNPEEVLRPELKPPGWLVWVPSGQPDSFLTTLVSIQGNRAFLVHLGGDAAVDLTVTGRPLVPVIPWQANAFNLVGFPIDEDAPPTFASYLGSSDALRDQPVYRLSPTGIWERVAVPDVEQMRFGEAYQVYAATGTSFIAPLALDVPTTDGLDYGRGVTSHTLRMTNTHDVAVTVQIAALTAPDPAPLSYFRVRTEAPGVGTLEWPPLPSPHQVTISAGAVRSERLALRRGDAPPGQIGTVLSVRDGLGTRWLLPLTARGLGGSAQAALSGVATGSDLAGLWVGNVIVDRVSQPNLHPAGGTPVGAVPGEKVCQGGPNIGRACAKDGDCAVYCSLHCASGQQVDEACTPATQAQACDGAACPAPASRCAGGVNDGLRCGSDADCQGSPCRTLTDRCKGGPREGALCDGIDGNDCPDGACGEVLRCANDQDVECTAETAATVCPGSTCAPIRLCTGGSRIGQACDAHDCPAGECVPPDNTCLGGADAGAACGRDADCVSGNCNASSRCLGGPNDNRACVTHANCGVSSCAAPSGRASEFPFRLILHVDGQNHVTLLKQVIEMFQSGTMTRDDDGTLVLGQVGKPVLLTDDELIPKFQGATLRDGVPVGRRLSTAAFDFPGNDLPMSNNGFGCGSRASAVIALDRNFPTNPYRHQFHPDHDNLSGAAGSTCRGGTHAGAGCAADSDCPDGRCEPVEEAFNITREIVLSFAAGTCSGGDRPGELCADSDECGEGGSCDPDPAPPPERCADEIEGVYRETIQGRHSKPIAVAGTFTIRRVTDVATLNPGSN
ncbi:MAG: hypothetical protein ACRERC_18165 [Candidatus Binatia bacterium]